MELKKFNKSHLILLIFLCSIIAIALLSANSLKNVKTYNSPNIMSSENQLKTSAEPFELTQDFEASTYFISPYSSPGVNDGVHFSFMGNKDGNYTIQIENYPAFLTNTEAEENYISFDNPRGGDLLYVGYSEINTFTGFTYNFKMAISKDGGKTWTNKLVDSISPNITEVLDLFYYVSGNAISVDPSTGFMIMVTWINATYLSMFRSFDNGTTWSDPITISNSSSMGAENLFTLLTHPRLEVAILTNGSILVVSDADDPNFTDLVYIQSDNNGTDWHIPRNVTCTKGSARAYCPKIQVNHTSGDYWLMWRDFPIVGGRNKTITWAEFKSDETLFDNVQCKNASKGYEFWGSMDFYYDSANDKVKFVDVDYNGGTGKNVIEVWSCSSFTTNIWTKETLGSFAGLGDLQTLIPHLQYMNYYYDGEHKLIFEKNYLGNNDIYQYTVLPNYIFWRQEGHFEKNVLKQIYWNGRKFDMSPITTSLVRVLFMENHTGQSGLKKLYIILDNEDPSITEFQQGRYYFNPQSSNVTLTTIPWDILPSESCDAFVEIFSEEIRTSSWSQIIDNSWDDTKPRIFLSDKRILYVLYETLEAGRNVIYLSKSYDMGITWSNPIKILETTNNIQNIIGASKGDIVFVHVYFDRQHQYLYRSFDEGVSFQDPINIYDASLFPSNARMVSDLEITNNGTMFMTYRISNTQYYIIRSSDLGINWTISKIFPGNDKMDINLHPSLGYDPVNDLLYLAMPMDNFSFTTFTRDLNISISTFNVSKNEWSSLYSTGIISVVPFEQQPYIYITRDNKTATPEARVLYLKDVNYQTLEVTYQELVSYDLGTSWTGPFDFESQMLHDVATNLYEIFYIQINTDGNDAELFLRREGRLTRIETYSLSSSFSKEITFDGIDDFGDYIDEGNYTYNIRLEDNAGNGFGKSGWFYADYNDPQLNDFSTSLSAPIPRYGLTVSVNITDGINFTAYLHYQKDNSNWQKVRMVNSSKDYFSATIPGDTTTNNVEYYVSATDLAGNEYRLDNDGSYYSYGMPFFVWSSEGLFKEDKEYSSSSSYTFEITISKDIEYVSEVIFRYSYDEGDSWEDLELEQSSPVFKGELDDIPGDLRELYYKIIIIDIYGNEFELTETQKIDFYPEVPSPEIDILGTSFLIVISAVIGFFVAFGYIRLKKVSHEMIYQKILRKELIKKTKNIKKDLGKDLDALETSKIATPFTITYLVVLCGTLFVFSMGMLFAYIIPVMGILILAGSLLLGVYGYMILMSRDITINVYLEKINKMNILLESFQMFFMLINIIMILLVGYTLDWFRYYLIESTFDFGALSIPRLYLSVLAVFFTSLVLVIITTYIQLRKTVYNILKQRTQGATENMLFFLKDQNSSRLITHTGYKTIVFLVTILLAIVTTTNLLNNETGVVLIIILVPFVIAGFSALIVHRIIERKQFKKRKEEMQMLFIESKKLCSKCEEPMYLSDRYCSSCGAQQVFADMMGTYVSRCVECKEFVHEKAKFCPNCGNVIKKSPIKKN